MVRDLDVQYEILSRWAANPDCVVGNMSAVVLERRTEPFLQPILDRMENPMGLLLNIYGLSGDRMLASRRGEGEDGSTEYCLMPVVHDFVAAVEQYGGWETVKGMAEKRVRMTMDNIARWVLSLPEPSYDD